MSILLVGWRFFRGEGASFCLPFFPFLDFFIKLVFTPNKKRTYLLLVRLSELAGTGSYAVGATGICGEAFRGVCVVGCGDVCELFTTSCCCIHASFFFSSKICRAW